MEQLKPDLFADGFICFWKRQSGMTASFGCRTFSTIKFLFQPPPRKEFCRDTQSPVGTWLSIGRQPDHRLGQDSKLLRFNGAELRDYADLSNHAGWLNDFAD